MNKSKNTYSKILIVGSSSSLSKALSVVFPDAIFFGRSNPHNLTNWNKSVSLDSASNISAVVEMIVDTMNPDNNYHLVLLQGISTNNWEESIYVNLISVAEIAESFAKLLATNNASGSITMIGSASSTLGGKVQYASTKAALSGVQNALLKNYSGNVRVNQILPGAFEGGMTADWNQEKIASINKKTYSGRLASAEEIADAIKFVILNDYVSGAVINMTSGQVK